MADAAVNGLLQFQHDPTPSGLLLPHFGHSIGLHSRVEAGLPSGAAAGPAASSLPQAPMEHN